MYCKLCGKHLYETITFDNLFRWNYVMHRQCERLHVVHKECIAVPMMNQMVLYDYLFERGYPDSDLDFLFTTYAGKWLSRVLKMSNWSILIFLDDINDSGDLPLVLELGSGTVIMLAMFDEEIIAKNS